MGQDHLEGLLGLTEDHQVISIKMEVQWEVLVEEYKASLMWQVEEHLPYKRIQEVVTAWA